MKIAVYAKDDTWKILMKSSDVEIVAVEYSTSLFEVKDVNAYFNFDSSVRLTNASGLPYFVNSVIEPIYELSAGTNSIRFNGWSGFIENSSWEVSGDLTHEAILVMESLHKNFITVADHPGFISARILSMIINEAYYAAGDGVASKDEIDIAMKLGTNYPYGPFEWTEIIGIENIYALLMKLSVTDDRYQPSPLLIKQFFA